MELKFDEKGLICAIVQDAYSGKVLMQAYMNQESFNKTIETGLAHYYSRSRKKLWLKGEESGHFQHVVEISIDCDCDCVLLRVKQDGAACHTGEYSCFYRGLKTFSDVPNSVQLYEDRETIRRRSEKPVEGSYTNYLMTKGVDKICKKIGEEASEVIIAAKNQDNAELACEMADLLFHMQILMENRGLTLEDVFAVMRERASKERVRNYQA